jgi:hypothetical protein
MKMNQRFRLQLMLMTVGATLSGAAYGWNDCNRPLAPGFQNVDFPRDAQCANIGLNECLQLDQGVYGDELQCDLLDDFNAEKCGYLTCNRNRAICYGLLPTISYRCRQKEGCDELRARVAMSTLDCGGGGGGGGGGGPGPGQCECDGFVMPCSMCSGG